MPRSALYGRDTVYVISKDDTLEKRTINLVASDRDTITLTSGVHDGERAVTSPLRGAEDGDKVTPADRTNLPDLKATRHRKPPSQKRLSRERRNERPH
ncbi:MAG: hypothetical protein R3C40_03405 [Parvularculaceae bacterium]